MTMKRVIKKLKVNAPMSLQGWLIFFSVMAVASVICALLRGVSTSDVHVPLIFVLAVLIISLLTDGYFYGTLAALSSVITVNYAFTYPYAKLDFSIYGYPLTFITMLAVDCVVSTLTFRVKTQERLQMESEKEKVRANLLRAVSHDLRTPLTSISGSLSTVLENGESMSPEAKKDLLRDALKDAEWLHRMVENLLSVTRIGDDGTDRLNTREELLEEVISEAVMNFRKHVPDMDITVCVPEEPMFVPMDAILIEQVLLNLLDNAVTHGGTTSKISIRVAQTASNAVISIEDNGGGIDAEQLEHLFDGVLPSVKNRRDDDRRGMGIGLTVCRTIIQVHGGTIYAENTRGGGARFVFTLPLGADNERKG